MLNYGIKHPFDIVEIYDLFCGTGFDGTKTHKGSPLRILDTVIKAIKANKNNKKVKLYFNDIENYKISELKKNIQKHYPNYNKNIEFKYTICDVKDYEIFSKKYYKLILLDQYGIKHLEKINNFLQKGTDVLIFVSSGHIRRFCEDANFEKYIKIPKEIFIKKPFYETHRTIVKYLRELFPKAYISPFTLIKDNENINGLIFFSAHRKGQEQFLKTAWKIDKDFGEGNINIDKDISREKGTLFYNKNIPTQKEEEYKSLLLEFLREKRNNIEIRNFGLDNGFLVKHTNVILKEIKNKLKCEYYGANFGFHLDKKEIKVYIWLKK
ncbi:TPA: three-Cys-motif partner protein TcmP [Campylobacter jejuni]|nr:three-Cys-motif partner protein TcmP [Campylobacter jejuni]